MVFEFAPNEQFNFLSAFAQRIGGRLDDATLTLPTWLGAGSIRRVRLAPDCSLLIHRYILTEELILRRTAAENSADRVTMLFHINAQPERPRDNNELVSQAPRDEYGIRITSPDISSVMRLPPNRALYFTVLTMARPFLRNLLQIKTMNRVVEQILVGQPRFLFYETVTADAQTMLKTLATLETQEELSELRIWIQVQGLLCWLFGRLLARGTRQHRPIHQADADQLDRVQSAVVADLSVPPQLPQLAHMAGMSVSKLTDLYKQVFGNSIYDYYQKARMEEAGHLLKQGGYSVAETGYRLGFSNLSHFSRLFARHHGLTPKRFATSHFLAV